MLGTSVLHEPLGSLDGCYCASTWEDEVFEFRKQVRCPSVLRTHHQLVVFVRLVTMPLTVAWMTVFARTGPRSVFTVIYPSLSLSETLKTGVCDWTFSLPVFITSSSMA